MNGANLSGAIDVIVVEQPDGELLCTPFHVRFGKYGVFYSGDKVIDIKINGQDILNLEMKLTDSGVGYFITQDNEEKSSVTEKEETTDKNINENTDENSVFNNNLQQQVVKNDKTQDSSIPVITIDSDTNNCTQSIDNKTKFLKSLPFNNSIFSMRKNRSLPDLTSLSNLSKQRDFDQLNVQNNIIDFSTSKSSKNGDIIDIGGLSEADVDSVDEGYFLPIKSNGHKTGKFRSYGDIAIHRKQSDSRLIYMKPQPNFLRGYDLKKHKEIKYDEYVKKSEINVNKKHKKSDVQDYDNEYDGDLEDNGLKPSPIMGNNSSINLIGEAALSDSEVDYDGRNNANLQEVIEHGEWKWGEIPKTKEEEAADKELLRKKKIAENESNKKKKQDKRRSGWNFWPFRRDVDVENSDDEDQCAKRMKQDEAITVEDLQAYINNPEKYDKYMGSTKFDNDKKAKREILVSATDSGNHSAILSNVTSAVTTPTSTDAMSINFDSDGGKNLGSLSDGLYDDDIITPTEDNKTIIDVKKREFNGKQRVPSDTSIASLPDPLFKEGGDNKHIEIDGQNKSYDKAVFSQSLPKDENILSLRIDIDGSSSSTIPPPSPMSPPLSPPPDDKCNFSNFKQTLRLTSSQLKSLNLHYGSNEAHFSITTKYQGTSWCSCHIYLFRWYDKIIISDIDGTITKSDILGHVIPAIGGQWAHSGVTKLYQRIKNNGYKMVYLSSRAIGQSYTTKNYLKNVNQNSEVLPDGPVLLCPDSIITAFRREVIERRPEEFKIACLSDLKALFPKELESNPFVAGFGNRDTDVKSYLAVGIPHNKILIVNPNGDVKCCDKMGISFSTNYYAMAIETVDYMFPPLINVGDKDIGKFNAISDVANDDEKGISNDSNSVHSDSQLSENSETKDRKVSTMTYVSPLQTSFKHSTTSSSFTFWRIPPNTDSI
uniref:LNS2 domain-containing protein n=1 Tax=Strongyloides venezuelensis TaxID=75913 RepID=A0A0K0G102_STRVS